MANGKLTIVGTGILTPAHLSQEAINQIQYADQVYVLVPDPLGLPTIQKLNKNVFDLGQLYYEEETERNGANRVEGYNQMVDIIMSKVRQDLNVCAVFYGHPGVFVYPAHECMILAKKEGYRAKMLPAISAEDCLFADLGVDPGDFGMQAYEATQFVLYNHPINTATPLILWQIGVVGDITFTKMQPSERGLSMLQERLLQHYDHNHTLILYEAATIPLMPPRIENIKVGELQNASVKTITTVYVPAVTELNLDTEFCHRWEIDLNLLEKMSF